ncbi:hypothetical protein [Agrobacterium pusense]|uniref:hypothetical protein n=1 Tax=Agrobacterium pusense TaxID=648995 RepID=UPI001C6E96F9|nr:hypothetical protein [Agrobacterium pusense]MBW9068291.1 hypothetical protein [Agrobacterium pusense]MBW9081763.1 hypothetical protein [Agrobacterium pusense]MBW9122911.1 hypothetical protein [Agrobacterium pusense]MBW9136873.1 hypothetical protein [Agrobacterium pusense]
MSSLPVRPLRVWTSSIAREIGEISGAFRIEVSATLMVEQTLKFLSESRSATISNPELAGFLMGADLRQPNENALFFWKTFENADALEKFDVYEIYKIVRTLELHCDVNLTVGRIVYLADTGAGPTEPLIIAERQPIGRGIGFEIEDRSAVLGSMCDKNIVISDKAEMAQQYYSTALGLLSLEDQISGLIDASFMQFYLSVETILEAHEAKIAVDNGLKLYGVKFSSEMAAIVSHVYRARHRFFGHAHVKWQKGQLDKNISFEIAKQSLVARWCARSLMELEIGGNLVHREMRLYSSLGRSIEFNGGVDLLLTEFQLPV